MSELVEQEWYQSLVDECKSIITEAVFTSRWALVEGYHQLGTRVLEENDNFERAKIYGDKIVQGLGNSLNISKSTIYYAIQFAKKYPKLDEVPEGKNITWNKVIQENIEVLTFSEHCKLTTKNRKRDKYGKLE